MHFLFPGSSDPTGGALLLPPQPKDEIVPLMWASWHSLCALVGAAYEGGLVLTVGLRPLMREMEATGSLSRGEQFLIGTLPSTHLMDRPDEFVWCRPFRNLQLLSHIKKYQEKGRVCCLDVWADFRTEICGW